MRVPDQIRKCVAFIGYKMADDSFELAGSALFFGDDSVEPKYAYVITAKHIIKGIREKYGLTGYLASREHEVGRMRLDLH